MTAALAVSDPVLTAFARDVGGTGPVTVVGGRTRWELGGVPAPGTRELTAPTGIVSYTPAEMTMVVRAGTTVAEVHHELAARGQRSALPERGGTVGGAVVVGEHHLDRRARGTVTATVLQVRYVSAEGRLVTGGGPTVKNVTGFDLPRLLVGSLGTLGLVAELILRTNPIPPESRWLTAEGVDPFVADDHLDRPSAVLWDGSRTWIHLEGHGPDVAADQAALAPLGTFTEVDGPPPLPPHRWSLTPAALRSLAPGAAASAASTAVTPEGPFVASIGVGTVWASSPAPSRPLDPAVATVSRRLKDNFDPTGRLNPGRRVG